MRPSEGKMHFHLLSSTFHLFLPILIVWALKLQQGIQNQTFSWLSDAREIIHYFYLCLHAPFVLVLCLLPYLCVTYKLYIRSLYIYILYCCTLIVYNTRYRSLRNTAVKRVALHSFNRTKELRPDLPCQVLCIGRKRFMSTASTNLTNYLKIDGSVQYSTTRHRNVMATCRLEYCCEHQIRDVYQCTGLTQ